MELFGGPAYEFHKIPNVTASLNKAEDLAQKNPQKFPKITYD